MSSSHRLRAVLITLAPVVLGAVLAVSVVVNQRQLARLEADASARAAVAAAVGQLGTAVEGQMKAAADGPGAADVVVSVVEIGRSSVSLDSAIGARDSGRPVLDETAKPPSIIVPLYGAGSAPQRTAERRTAITGYRIVPITLGPQLALAAPEGGGLVLAGPERAAVAQPGPPPVGASRYVAPLGIVDAPGWTLEAWLPRPPLPGVTWFWLLGLLVLFGGLAVGSVVLQRHARASAVHRHDAERQRALVTGLVPVVQATLDLGEVVPAASLHLAEGLALAGLSVSVPAIRGERQLFCWGAMPDANVPPTTTPAAQLEPGETFAVALTRGGRMLGVLRVVAGERLQLADLRALATASDLLGSTLANAEAFARQAALVENMRSVDELKTVFLATASHELRTPVTAIVGFSALLLEQWDSVDPVQGRVFLERVLANARGLETLIEQLLDFSRLERGMHPTTSEALDLGGTTARILEEQPELTADHQLRCNLSKGCIVRGSTAAIERIVTNLVGNAAKYSPEGTAITVTVHGDGEHVTLLVDDEGPGVPERDRERIFSRFFRGGTDSVARTRGAGIGLAIVSEFAASMAGTASVGVSPSGGARFSISFPEASPLAGAALDDAIRADAHREEAPRVPLS